MRLDKYLSDMGCGTRSEVKKAIRQGSVSVGGQTVTDPGFSVETDGSAAVLFRGEPVVHEEFVYYMLHKPAGVITASEDRHEKTVIDLITGPVRKDLFPVGRLDRDTEGLLLITNDGALAHRLLSPRRHVDKVYLARIDGPAGEAEIEAFRNGLHLPDGLVCQSAELRALPRKKDENAKSGECAPATGEAFEVEVTIREGKFHQIKRMFRAVGREVLYLKRLSMGPLRLDPDLPPGAFRRLTGEEAGALKKLM